MSLAGLEGRSYGPFRYSLQRVKSDEFVAATGDDPARWTAAAPPGFAAALLFAAAPAFFSDPAVGPYTSILLHTDQQFAWNGPLAFGTDLDITGTVTSVRERAGLNLVTFVADAAAGDGSLVTSTSTFMMSDATPPSDSPEEAEPAHDARGPCDVPAAVDAPGDEADLPPLAKSASRADLVRYAGATGDFNPLHWDHDSARRAGVAGIVVHGLLMASWFGQFGARLTSSEMPLADMRLRFRRPLRPAVAATVTGAVGESSRDSLQVKGAVAADDLDLVTGSCTVRLGE